MLRRVVVVILIAMNSARVAASQYCDYYEDEQSPRITTMTTTKHNGKASTIGTSMARSATHCGRTKAFSKIGAAVQAKGTQDD